MLFFCCECCFCVVNVVFVLRVFVNVVFML